MVMNCRAACEQASGALRQRATASASAWIPDIASAANSLRIGFGVRMRFQFQTAHRNPLVAAKARRALWRKLGRQWPIVSHGRANGMEPGVYLYSICLTKRDAAVSSMFWGATPCIKEIRPVPRLDGNL